MSHIECTVLVTEVHGSSSVKHSVIDHYRQLLVFPLQCCLAVFAKNLLKFELNQFGNEKWGQKQTNHFGGLQTDTDCKTLSFPIFPFLMISLYRSVNRRTAYVHWKAQQLLLVSFTLQCTVHCCAWKWCASLTGNRSIRRKEYLAMTQASRRTISVLFPIKSSLVLVSTPWKDSEMYSIYQLPNFKCQ